MTLRHSSRAKFACLLLVLAGTLVMVNCGSSSSSSSSSTTTTTTPATNNSVALTVGFGPNGQAGGYYDGIFTTVSICQHGTSTCQVVDNVLVDTGFRRPAYPQLIFYHFSTELAGSRRGFH